MSLSVIERLTVDTWAGMLAKPSPTLPGTWSRHVTSRWLQPLFVWKDPPTELDPGEAGRIRDALASVGHAVLPPGAAVEYIVPLVPRTFRARTALGLARAT